MKYRIFLIEGWRETFHLGRNTKNKSLFLFKGKGQGHFYLTSVVPSVLQRDCYQWKPTVRPLPPLPLSVLRFTGIQSYGYTDQRKVEAGVEVTEDRTAQKSRELAN